MSRRCRQWGLAAILAAVCSGAASASVLTYGSTGTVNPASYSFTAVADGNVVGYFVGGDAAYGEVIGMAVNGVSTGVVGLDNHASSVGQTLDFGFVHAGNSIMFADYIYTSGVVPNGAPGGAAYVWDSLPGDNSDSLQHIYASWANAGAAFAGSPAGIYIGFEDLPHGGDLDYNDTQFLVTNVANAVPEASTWLMLAMGFGGFGAMAFRRKRKGADAATA